MTTERERFERHVLDNAPWAFVRAGDRYDVQTTAAWWGWQAALSDKCAESATEPKVRYLCMKCLRDTLSCECYKIGGDEC